MSNKPAGACMYVSVPGPPGSGTDCAILRRSVDGHSGSGSMSSRGTSLMRGVAALRVTARGSPVAIRGTQWPAVMQSGATQWPAVMQSGATQWPAVRVGESRDQRGISGHQWSSVVIRGHQWSSVVIRRHQRQSRTPAAPHDQLGKSRFAQREGVPLLVPLLPHTAMQLRLRHPLL